MIWVYRPAMDIRSNQMAPRLLTLNECVMVLFADAFKVGGINE